MVPTLRGVVGGARNQNQTEEFFASLDLWHLFFIFLMFHTLYYTCTLHVFAYFVSLYFS